MRARAAARPGRSGDVTTRDSQTGVDLVEITQELSDGALI